MSKYELLEETGHSYSGISDIVFNKPEQANELLIQIDDRYNELIKEQESLERQLEAVKSKRGMMVSNFIHIHKAFNTAMEVDTDQPLSFVKDGFYTEITILSVEDGRINYEKKKITVKL